MLSRQLEANTGALDSVAMQLRHFILLLEEQTICSPAKTCGPALSSLAGHLSVPLPLTTVLSHPSQAREYCCATQAHLTVRHSH